jgi:CheY-like chemotaxis protein
METPMLLLLDEDDRFVAAADNFLSAAGYQIVPARDGSVALFSMRSLGDRISIALMDFDRLDVSGLLLLRHMRNMHPNIPILATSAAPSQILGIAEFLGTRAVLEKPITSAWVSAIGSVANSLNGREATFRQSAA